MPWSRLLDWVQANAGPLLVALALCGLTLYAAWVGLALRRLNRRLEGLFPPGSTSLEDLVISLSGSVSDLGNRVDKNLERCRDLADRLACSPRHLGIVRFNAFPDAGSALSFAVALLDDHRNGLVLSSIYGRQQGMVFAKPITGGASSFPLTEEEREAIRTARTQCTSRAGTEPGRSN